MNDPREIENPSPVEQMIADVREAGQLHTAQLDGETVKQAIGRAEPIPC